MPTTTVCRIRTSRTIISSKITLTQLENYLAMTQYIDRNSCGHRITSRVT